LRAFLCITALSTMERYNSLASREPGAAPGSRARGWRAPHRVHHQRNFGNKSAKWGWSRAGRRSLDAISMRMRQGRGEEPGLTASTEGTYSRSRRPNRQLGKRPSRRHGSAQNQG
jgi:hypothetical protein